MTRLPLVLCVAASLAFAQNVTPTDQVRVQLHEYYRGERLSGFVPFVGSGVGSVVAGTLLLTSNTTLGRGAGWTNLSFGVLEIAAGLYFALSSYGKERSLDAALTANPAEFAKSERERVARILNRFQPILLAVEGALSVGGGVFAGLGALRRDELMLGVGLGFAVQGLVMFLLDWAVLDRASAYSTALSLFRPP
ncbi:MAG: hypothetical protein Q8L48_30290 [Archangium sp.]|nr:hypothetical protein [Archangium sp.]